MLRYLTQLTLILNWDCQRMSQQFRLECQQSRVLKPLWPITRPLLKHKRRSRYSTRKTTIFWGMMTFSLFLPQGARLTQRGFKRTIKTNFLASRKISCREILHLWSMPALCQLLGLGLSKQLKSRLLRELLMFKNRMWASLAKSNHNPSNSSSLRKRISQRTWSMSLRPTSKIASNKRIRLSI